MAFLVTRLPHLDADIPRWDLRLCTADCPQPGPTLSTSDGVGVDGHAVGFQALGRALPTLLKSADDGRDDDKLPARRGLRSRDRRGPDDGGCSDIDQSGDLRLERWRSEGLQHEEPEDLQPTGEPMAGGHAELEIHG